MATTENLKEAFAGESQANRKYLAFAKKADADGKPQIAKLFRAAAAAETIHAHAHFNALEGVNSTEENLHAAIQGEGFEFKTMYPRFIDEAENEASQKALMSFKNAMVVEEIHHRLYSEALKTAENGNDLADRPIFVCDVCGNTVYIEAPAKCPVCGASASHFMTIE